MQIIASHPIEPKIMTPYLGKPIGAVLANGDMEYGVLDRFHENHAVFRPADLSVASVRQMQQAMKQNAKVQELVRKSSGKAEIKGFGYGPYGYGGGYPHGWGYGNYGWGAGWWWFLPLFFILAFVAFPFWW